MRLSLILPALAVALSSCGSPPPALLCHVEPGLFEPTEITIASGSTSTNAMKITAEFRNPTKEAVSITGATVTYSEAGAVCAATAGAVTVTPTTVPAGTNVTVELAHSITTNVPPDTNGSCGWLAQFKIQSSCGEVGSATVGTNLHATIAGP